MRLLITGASTPLGRALAARLHPGHDLRLSDSEATGGDIEFVACDLGHEGPTDALVEGVDALIHIPRAAQAGDGAAIDAHTRQTYNLLLAALQAGVRQVILASSLDLFAPYDEDMAVNENWRPLPSTDTATLAPHLAEFVAREFAHDGALKVLCLRLGHLVDVADTADLPYDPMWLATTDAADACAAVLQHLQRAWDDPEAGEAPAWAVFHLQHDGPGARFSSRRFKQYFDFTPRTPFEEKA